MANHWTKQSTAVDDSRYFSTKFFFPFELYFGGICGAYLFTSDTKAALGLWTGNVVCHVVCHVVYHVVCHVVCHVMCHVMCNVVCHVM